MNLTHPAYTDIRLSPVDGDPCSWRLMVNFNRVDRKCMGFVYRAPGDPRKPTYTNSNGRKEFKKKKDAAEDLLNVGVFRG